MVRDRQVRMLIKLINEEETLGCCCGQGGNGREDGKKMARLRYASQSVKDGAHMADQARSLRGGWEEVRAKLAVNPGFEAKTLFEDLQRRYPERFSDGQIRSLQRRIKAWRALVGPQKEVFFPQVHDPGKLCESDLTGMGELEITIQGQFSIIWSIILYFHTPTGRLV